MPADALRGDVLRGRLAGAACGCDFSRSVPHSVAEAGRNNVFGGRVADEVCCAAGEEDVDAD